ncbi:MAG TPA: SAM-dependent chlorinase/fluorinase [Phycisphaerae bacterium]|nr:SAM-dependent chlorinase/fluorinase [Phycisphaerae bacterium]HRY68117.1 SAM-dependent chlorinase/fluorinase [Phycisphaerae bacterium]HSA28800.1 SAM-dependent chlorinase/fluorinase [Phycisphaerae bacterium]
MSTVALLTDFGTRDHYAATMKGMILQINPKVTLVDVTHEIAPQHVLEGAFVLRQTLPFFPVETVFVVVVDPTVGTSRRILAARYNNRFVLAPDNGLLTFLHRDAQLQEIRVVENRQFMAATLSATFHGRDILAPVAGHVSRGTALDRLGPPADRVEVLDIPRLQWSRDGSITGQVIYVDHFGNLITNIAEADLSGPRLQVRGREVMLGDRRIGPVRITYADVPRGEPVALIGSTCMLEIAINAGNAAHTLQAGCGTRVHMTP